ncbi:hypothetical protein JHK86_040326 [Glycine max]|nr:hypothetical protein JHK86_040326 [Glycine max]
MAYESHVTKALYKENIEKVGDQKTIMYNLMCEKVKIWTNILNKNVLHKSCSKTTLLDVHKFILFHLMDNISFELPHTIYITIPHNLRVLGGLDDIYYVVLMNKILWDQGFYQMFDKMDKDDDGERLDPTPYSVAFVLLVAKGLPGAYTEDVVLKEYPQCETVPCEDFKTSFKAVESWLVDKAVLPIENSTGESIHHNYDLLLGHKLLRAGRAFDELACEWT